MLGFEYKAISSVEILNDYFRTNRRPVFGFGWLTYQRSEAIQMEQLEKWSRDGWELVGVTPKGRRGDLYFLKRQRVKCPHC